MGKRANPRMIRDRNAHPGNARLGGSLAPLDPRLHGDEFHSLRIVVGEDQPSGRGPGVRDLSNPLSAVTWISAE